MIIASNALLKSMVGHAPSLCPFQTESREGRCSSIHQPFMNPFCSLGTICTRFSRHNFSTLVRHLILQFRRVIGRSAENVGIPSPLQGFQKLQKAVQGKKSEIQEEAHAAQVPMPFAGVGGNKDRIQAPIQTGHKTAAPHASCTSRGPHALKLANVTKTQSVQV